MGSIGTGRAEMSISGRAPIAEALTVQAGFPSVNHVMSPSYPGV